jgi:hypothetical protein
MHWRPPLHQAVEEPEECWLTLPPQPDALFDWCARSPRSMRGWPLPEPPDAKHAPPPHRPQAHAAPSAPCPHRLGELPAARLRVPVQWGVRLPEPAPAPAAAAPVRKRKTRMPELWDIDGDGVPDEKVDLYGDGRLETVVTIAVGAPVVLTSETEGADVFYTVGGR